MEGLALLLTAHVASTCPGVRATVLDVGVLESVLPEADWLLTGEACRERPLLRLVGSVDGRVVRTVTLRPRLELERKGWTLVRDVEPGDAVELTEAWVPHELPAVPRGRLRAVRALRAGQPVGAFDVDVVPDAPRGSRVDLVVRRGALTLTAEGRLLADASLDAETRAVNPVTGAVLKGILTDPTTVEIR